MNFSIEINQAVEWTIIFLSVSILIDTFEKFRNIKEFKSGGIFDWEWMRQFFGYSKRRPIIRKFADSVFGLRMWFFLLTLRGLAAIVLLLFFEQAVISSFALFILFFVGSLENFRRMPFFPEMPNRFTLLIFGALFLRSLAPTEFVTLACLWFIALQSCLSYATAGIYKLLNKDWRTGNGVLNAANSPYYFTSPVPARILLRNPPLALFLNYFTIAVESLFPLVLLIGKPYYLFFLVWGVLFHLVNAYFIRLNNYFWTWIATYPAILYIAQN